ncbi:MAG: hypothetical protein AAF709_26235 [Pseudomonadota bacterium]
MTLSSLGSAVAQAEIGPAHFWQNKPASRQTDRVDWYGTSSFEEAANYARYGWKDGLKNLVSANLSLADLAEGHTALRSEDRDVFGCRPDVALYCAGAPDHMVVPGDRLGPSAPLVDMVVQGSYSNNNEAEEIINHGAALASLIDATESEGRRVQLTMAFGIVAGAFEFDVLIRIKQHSEPLDMDRLAFALSNPSMFRRIVFSYIEQGQSAQWHNAFRHSYGQPKPYSKTGSEIIVPSLQHWQGDHDWSTPESAFDTMKTALTKELQGEAA